MNPTFGLGFVRNGYLMVDFFFVLSGFVIAYNYADRLTDTRSTVRFMWLRFWRLYPLHFFMLAVFVTIEGAKYLLPAQTLAQPILLTGAGAASVIANILLLQGIYNYGGPGFNQPSWSVSVEFLTYPIFALVACVARGTRVLAIVSAAIAGAALLVLALRSGSLNQLYGFALVRCLLGFFLGVIAFAAYRRQSVGGRHFGGVVLALMAGLSIVVLLSFKPAVAWDFAVPPLASILIYGLSVSERGMTLRVLTSAPFAWLGKVSYSIYMVHFLVIWALDHVVRSVLRVPQLPATSNSEILFKTPPLLGAALTIIAVMLVLLVSHFTYRLIEAPPRRWARSHPLALRSAADQG
jgi:peptidoglycan/LPS O-acetylase OafA/YrhL